VRGKVIGTIATPDPCDVGFHTHSVPNVNRDVNTATPLGYDDDLRDGAAIAKPRSDGRADCSHREAEHQHPQTAEKEVEDALAAFCAGRACPTSKTNR
jgi:hypothetical protein